VRAEDARCGARHIDETNTLSFFRRASAHRLAPVVARCELGRARFRRIRRSRHAMATAGMRGLNIFIQDVRNAANKEVEQERVDKELANIRKKFKKVKDMTPYDRKKCVMRRVFSSRHPPRPDPRRSRKRHFDAFQRFSSFVKTQRRRTESFSDGRGAIPPVRASRV
jgi:hypothetical protein